MTNLEAVRAACHRMGVPFAVLDEEPEGVDEDSGGFLRGPASGGCHPEKGVYLLREDGQDGDAWAWVLHELSHVVWWHPENGVNVCEKPLIAWEYAVARHLGIRGFWSCMYTMTTRIDYELPRMDVGDWSRPQRSAWFAQARQECVRRGALTPDFKPTWRRPDWSVPALSDTTHKE